MCTRCVSSAEEPGPRKTWQERAGKEEALKGAQELKKHNLVHFDVAFTSALTRANQTLEIILQEIGQPDLETIKAKALNERGMAPASFLSLPNFGV